MYPKHECRLSACSAVECRVTRSEQKSFIEQTVEWRCHLAALSPKGHSEINICVTLVLIFVYLTAQLKSNADGCLSQTYTSLGVFCFSSFAYLLAHAFLSPRTPLLSTVKLINIFFPSKRSASAGERCDWQWKANNVVCPFCVHLSYLSDVNTQMVPSLFSTRHSALALWQEINCSQVSFPTNSGMI